MQEVTKDTGQYIKNKSFDPTFQVETVELLGHDSTNNILRRIQVTDTGNVKVSI